MSDPNKTRYVNVGGKVVEVPDDPKSLMEAVKYEHATKLPDEVENEYRRRALLRQSQEGAEGAARSFAEEATLGTLPALESHITNDVSKIGQKEAVEKAEFAGEAHPIAGLVGSVAPLVLAPEAVAEKAVATAAKGLGKKVAAAAARASAEQALQQGITAGSKTYLHEMHLPTNPEEDGEHIAAHALDAAIQSGLENALEGGLVGGLMGGAGGALGHYMESAAAKAAEKRAAGAAGMLAPDAVDSGGVKHFKDLALKGEDAQALGIAKGRNGDSLGELMYGPENAESYRKAVIDQGVNDVAALKKGAQGIPRTVEEAAQADGQRLAEHFNAGLKEVDSAVADMPTIKKSVFGMADQGADGKLAQELIQLRNELRIDSKTTKALRDLGETDTLKAVKEARAAIDMGAKSGATVEELGSTLERAREALAKLGGKVDQRALSPAQQKALALEARIGQVLGDETVMGERAAKGYNAIRKFGDDLLEHDANLRAFVSKDAKGIRTANVGAFVEAIKGMDGAAQAEQIKKALDFLDTTARFRSEVLNASGGGPGKMTQIPAGLAPTVKSGAAPFKSAIAQAVKNRDVASLVERSFAKSTDASDKLIGAQAFGVGMYQLMRGNPLGVIPFVAGKAKNAMAEVLGANPLQSAARLRNWSLARQYGKENVARIAEDIAKGRTSSIPMKKPALGGTALIGKISAMTPESLVAAVRGMADFMPNRSTLGAVTAMRALTYLQTQAPKPMDSLPGTDPIVQRLSPDGYAKDRYNPVEVKQFERKVSAVADPDQAFKRWGAGQLTQEEAQALRFVYPQQTQAALQAVREQVMQNGGRVSFTTAYRYKMLAGADSPAIIPSMTPEFVQATQKMYQTTAPGTAYGQDGGPKKSPVTSTNKLNTNPATGAAPSVALDASMQSGK